MQYRRSSPLKSTSDLNQGNLALRLDCWDKEPDTHSRFNVIRSIDEDRMSIPINEISGELIASRYEFGSNY